MIMIFLSFYYEIVIKNKKNKLVAKIAFKNKCIFFCLVTVFVFEPNK